MNTADKSTITTFGKIVIAALIVIAGLFAFHKCAEAQTAGTIDFSRDYSARLDEILTEQYGVDWKRVIRDDWAEAWKNLTSTAREGYQQRRASLFDESGLEQYLTQTEARQVARALDSARARKAAEDQRIADSIAAAQQTQGSVALREASTTQLAGLGLGIGKALSQRLAFLGGFEDTHPQPAPSPPTGSPTFAGIAEDVLPWAIIGTVLIVFAVIAISQ